jgi:hypothetical protein
LPGNIPKAAGEAIGSFGTSGMQEVTGDVGQALADQVPNSGARSASEVVSTDQTPGSSDQDTAGQEPVLRGHVQHTEYRPPGG